MAATLRDCCDEDLVLADSTIWVGVSAELRDEMRNVLADEGGGGLLPSQ
jgi:hypothetical protein